MSLKTLYVDIYSPATPVIVDSSDDELSADSNHECAESEDPLIRKPASCNRPSIVPPISTNQRGRPRLSKSVRFSSEPKSIIAEILEKERAKRIISEDIKNVDLCLTDNNSQSLPMLSPIQCDEWTQVPKATDDFVMKKESGFQNVVSSLQLTQDDAEGDLAKDSEIEFNTIKTKLICNKKHCSFVAETKKEMNKHKKLIHQKDKDHRCIQCQYIAVSALELRKHCCPHTGELGYPCPHEGCNFKGKNSHNLDYHNRKMHYTGEPLRCEHKGCDYTTKFVPSLKIHKVKKHSAEKTIACELCPYRCHFIGELRKHSMAHSSATPYACDFAGCNYACKISSNLRKHKRIHTEERPYACEQCPFRSNFVSSLKAHKRTHTDERPYCCDQCGYRCNSSSNLKKHVLQRHPGTPYSFSQRTTTIINTQNDIGQDKRKHLQNETMAGGVMPGYGVFNQSVCI